jgi:hypothetical protein
MDLTETLQVGRTYVLQAEWGQAGFVPTLVNLRVPALWSTGLNADVSQVGLLEFILDVVFTVSAPVSAADEMERFRALTREGPLISQGATARRLFEVDNGYHTGLGQTLGAKVQAEAADEVNFGTEVAGRAVEGIAIGGSLLTVALIAVAVIVVAR